MPATKRRSKFVFAYCPICCDCEFGSEKHERRNFEEGGEMLQCCECGSFRAENDPAIDDPNRWADAIKELDAMVAAFEDGDTVTIEPGSIKAVRLTKLVERLKK